MAKYNTYWYNVYSRVVFFLSGVQFRFNNTSRSMTREQCKRINELLNSQPYLILTKKNRTLSGLLVGILVFIGTGKWPKYTHIAMSLGKKRGLFKFIEATRYGVHYSGWGDIFDAESICFIRPTNLEDWNNVVDKVQEYLGREYDNLFDIRDDSRLSCVELIRVALQVDDDYNENFKNFEASVQSTGNVTPDMFRNSEDFSVVYEIEK